MAQINTDKIQRAVTSCTEKFYELGFKAGRVSIITWLEGLDGFMTLETFLERNKEFLDKIKNFGDDDDKRIQKTQEHA